MGITGAGKSFFIKHTSGISVKIGDGLQSCTSAIECVTYKSQGVDVSLVDTPGFDDTNKTDTEILELVSEWMARTYEAGLKLKGIIYLHRISDVRMQGSALRNLNMFRKLCGDQCFTNVILMTSRWDSVPPEIGAAREKELAETFWKPMLTKGSRMSRYVTDEDGKNAINSLLGLPPVVLTIQREIVDEHKDLIDTGAGSELSRELATLKKRYEKQLQELKESMEEADIELKRMLNEEAAKTKALQQKIEQQAEQLKKAKRPKTTPQLEISSPSVSPNPTPTPQKGIDFLNNVLIPAVGHIVKLLGFI